MVTAQRQALYKTLKLLDTLVIDINISQQAMDHQTNIILMNN